MTELKWWVRAWMRRARGYQVLLLRKVGDDGTTYLLLASRGPHAAKSLAKQRQDFSDWEKARVSS